LPPEESFASQDVGSLYRYFLPVLIIAEEGMQASTFLDPTPAKRSSTPRKGKRKKATGRQRQR
jgi:hypothetical protein